MSIVSDLAVPIALNAVPGVQKSQLAQLGVNMYLGGWQDLKNSFKSQTMMKAPTAKAVDMNSLSNNLNYNLNKIGSYIPRQGEKQMIKVSKADVAFVDSLLARINTPSTMQKTASWESVGKALGTINGLLDSTDKGMKIFDWVAKKAPKPKSLLTEMLESPALKSAIPLLNIAALGGLGLTGAGIAYDKISDAVKKETAYHQMFDEFPELNDMPRAQVDKYWGVLSDFAPKLTTNPLVAGQFISNMNTYGLNGIDHNTVGQLAQINKSLEANNSEVLKSLGSLGVKGFEHSFDSILDLDE